MAYRNRTLRLLAAFCGLSTPVAVLAAHTALLTPPASHDTVTAARPGRTSQSQATISGTVGVAWGSAGTATLVTNADGLRLLASGRSTDSPWRGIDSITITLSTAETLSASDVSVTGITVANYGPVTVSGSGTSYTITFAQPIDSADRVTITIGNADINTFTRRLDVLPGDVNDDGSVTIDDAVVIRNQIQGYEGASPTVFGDIDGDGTVNVTDYNLARSEIGSALPSF